MYFFTTKHSKICLRESMSVHCTCLVGILDQTIVFSSSFFLSLSFVLLIRLMGGDGARGERRWSEWKKKKAKKITCCQSFFLLPVALIEGPFLTERSKERSLQVRSSMTALIWLSLNEKCSTLSIASIILVR